MEFRLLKRSVFAPVAETEFRLDVARLPDSDACELIVRIHFEKHFAECIPVFLPRLANQDSVPSFGRAFFRIFYRRNGPCRLIRGGLGAPANSRLPHSLSRFTLPVRRARGVRQSELSLIDVRLAV